MAESTATDQLSSEPQLDLTDKSEENTVRCTAKVPVIVITKDSSIKQQCLKYILPKKFTISRLLNLIRKTKLYSPEEAVYFYACNKILSYDSLINDVYHKFKGEDGCLYLTMTNIPAFG